MHKPHFTMAMLLTISLLAAAVAAQTYPLGAQSPVTDSFSQTNGLDRNLGWRFKANGTNITVVELGCWLPNSATTSHTVSLFDVASTNLLAQVTVAPGAGWQYTTLTTPVSLTNGSDYCVVAFAPNGPDYYWKNNPGSQWNPTGTIEYLGSVNANQSTTANTYPTGFQTTYMRGLADIGYTTSAAPTITSTAPSTAVVGSQYSYTVTATGSPTPAFSISGTLPGWLNWDNVDTLSGTPTATGTAGPFTITATNGVSPDDMETFSISIVAADPEIDITDPNANAVTSGDTLTVYAGVAAVSSLGTFTITNSGTTDLNLTGTPLVDVGTSESNCTVIITPPTINPLPPGSDTFDVDVAPTAAGPFSFTLTILSNDADEGTFTINFSGIAKTTAEAEIAVRDFNGADITSGGTVAETNTGTALFNRAFTIRNEGGLALNLTGTTAVAVSGESNCTVNINQPASNTLAASGTWAATTEGFSLDITPTAAGLFSFTVTIVNNDTDEGTFTFTYSGDTVTGSGTGGGGGGGGGDGGGCTSRDTGAPWLLLLGLLSALALATRLRRSNA